MYYLLSTLWDLDFECVSPRTPTRGRGLCFGARTQVQGKVLKASLNFTDKTKSHKMKYLILIYLFSIPCLSSAQKFDKIQPLVEQAVQDWETGDDQQVYLSEIVAVSGATKAELFRRAEGYISTAYNDAKTVTEAKSVEEGFILVKALLPVTVVYASTPVVLKFQHLLRIDTKEGKARIVLTMVNDGSAGTPARWNTYYPFVPTKKDKPKTYEKAQGRQFYVVDLSARATIEGLKAALLSAPAGAGDSSEW